MHNYVLTWLSFAPCNVNFWPADVHVVVPTYWQLSRPTLCFPMVSQMIATNNVEADTNKKLDWLVRVPRAPTTTWLAIMSSIRPTMQPTSKRPCTTGRTCGQIQADGCWRPGHTQKMLAEFVLFCILRMQKAADMQKRLRRLCGTMFEMLVGKMSL